MGGKSIISETLLSLIIRKVGRVLQGKVRMGSQNINRIAL